MPIVKIYGGLGNQMFQYALYRKLQKRYPKVKVDIWRFFDENVNESRKLELKYFPIKLRTCSELEKKLRDNSLIRWLEKHIGFNELLYIEHVPSVYLSEVFNKRCALLEGYWQSEKYFIDIRGELLEDFTFPESVTREEDDILHRIREGDSVSVHIRRGDYLENISKYGGICTKEYYQNAIHYIEKRMENPQYYVFSDDMKWSKQFMGAFENVFFVELGDAVSSIHDMKLMANCKHNIIANSSFSWWASWLNQNPRKIVIAPKQWQNMAECPDIKCGNWIRM